MKYILYYKNTQEVLELKFDSFNTIKLLKARHCVAKNGINYTYKVGKRIVLLH